MPLTDPSFEQFMTQVQAVFGFALDDQIGRRAYEAASSWPSGVVQTSANHKGERLMISWEWIDGYLTVDVEMG